MDINDAINIVVGDVQSQEELQAYLKLLHYVYERRDAIKHLSYSNIARVMETARPELALKAAQYFSGDHVKILQMRFELITDHECLLLDNEQIYNAELTGELIHPETGRPVENYESFVFPFFTPTEEVRND